MISKLVVIFDFEIGVKKHCSGPQELWVTGLVFSLRYHCVIDFA